MGDGSIFPYNTGESLLWEKKMKEAGYRYYLLTSSGKRDSLRNKLLLWDKVHSPEVSLSFFLEILMVLSPHLNLRTFGRGFELGMGQATSSLFLSRPYPLGYCCLAQRHTTNPLYRWQHLARKKGHMLFRCFSISAVFVLHLIPFT